MVPERQFCFENMRNHRPETRSVFLLAILLAPLNLFARQVKTP
jgi:hypothetical protein